MADARLKKGPEEPAAEAPTVAPPGVADSHGRIGRSVCLIRLGQLHCTLPV